MDKQEEFRKKILATFTAEAKENIASMTAHLLDLEKNPDEEKTREVFELLYRAAHSLKGASRAVEFHSFESLCHSFEDLMTALRSGEIKFTEALFDLMFASVDFLELLLQDIDGDEDDILSTQVTELRDNIELAEAGLNFTVPAIQKKSYDEEKPKYIAPPSPAPEEKKETPVNDQAPKKTKTSLKAEETIRISVSKIDNLLAQAEEMVSIKLVAEERTKKLKKLYQSISQWNKEAGKLSLMLKGTDNEGYESSCQFSYHDKINSFCSWSSSHMKTLEKEISDQIRSSAQEEHIFNLRINSLLNEAKNLITLPLSTLSDGFPKMVRDISRDLQKKIELRITGDNLEIDRRILEKIRNPIIHLLRNSIDYGIETPAERIKKGKAETGTILLAAELSESGKIELELRDDGAGIDLEKIKKVYQKNEKISDKDLNNSKEEELLDYIFKSGVTTSEIVTDLSGRGLGMAIVQDSIEELGGSIKVSTEKNSFTCFKMTLPLNIITFKGIHCKVSGRSFIIPAHRVNRVIRIRPEEIVKAGNNASLKIDGRYIALARLNQILDLPDRVSDEKFLKVVIVEAKANKTGFILDEIIGEQEVLTKSFNRQLTRIRNINGATILGSGEVVPILNIVDLCQAAKNTSLSPVVERKATDKPKEKKNVLIVEDSITSRTLLKNILESSGYSVTTAFDGVDAYTKLKEGEFDAILTDVEMPRMNGFELTTKIRKEEKYAEIPVILITSLSKREHKEKGIEAGASAYIVKSSFNQNNLMQTLERLII